MSFLTAIIGFLIGAGLAFIYHSGIMGLEAKAKARLTEELTTAKAKLQAAEAKIAAQLSALGKKL